MNSIYNNEEISAARKIFDSALLKNLTTHTTKRLEILTAFFDRHAVPYHLVPLKGHTHCVVSFPQRTFDKNFVTKIFIAHYDINGTGAAANDNSAACVQLAFFAGELQKETVPHNIHIIFTAGEELQNKGLHRQGAFFLGLGLRELNKVNSTLLFVFDLCGRGDSLVVSDAGIFSRDSAKTQKLKNLQRIAIHCAKNAALPYYRFPTAFSDNAGFLASGCNAQLITVLPHREAESFVRGLKTLEQHVSPEIFARIVRECIIEGHNENDAAGKIIEKIKPDTWKMMHTEHDTIEHLQLEAFILMHKYFHALKTCMIPPDTINFKQ